MPRIMGAGILMFRNNKKTGKAEIFVCSPGGPMWKNKVCWNIPKGQIEEGEEPIDAALREFYEETGIDLSDKKDKLRFEELVRQNSKKSVYVFSYKWNGEDTEHCHSNMFVFEKDGKEYPEIGKYAWMTSEEIQKAGGVPAYYPVFDANWSAEFD